MENYETATQVAERLGIGSSQVRRYCEEGRLQGAFKPHARMWLIPKGAFPALFAAYGRPPRWASGPRTVGQVYGIPDGSWRSISPEETRRIDLYPATAGQAGVRADVINFAPGTVEVADELFSSRYVDRPTPLPAALVMGRGYANALVVVYDYDLQGRRGNFRTLRVTKELMIEGKRQLERLRIAAPLNAGRELDFLVAEKVMGWERAGTEESEVPPYSTVAGEGIQVALRMANNGWYWEMRVTEPDQRYVAAFFRGSAHKERYEAEGWTLQEAVCRAALEAVGCSTGAKVVSEP